MKLYSYTINGSPCGQAYTSLSALCRDKDLPHSSASHGKRKFVIDEAFVEIYELEIVKIIGRPCEKNFKRNEYPPNVDMEIKKPTGEYKSNEFKYNVK